MPLFVTEQQEEEVQSNNCGCALDCNCDCDGKEIFDSPQVLVLQKGDTGAGVATGGTTGQVLTKQSSTNFDTTWTNLLNPVYVQSLTLFTDGADVSALANYTVYRTTSGFIKYKLPL